MQTIKKDNKKQDDVSSLSFRIPRELNEEINNYVREQGLMKCAFILNLIKSHLNKEKLKN